MKLLENITVVLAYALAAAFMLWLVVNLATYLITK
jgi:hypothetical protein